MKGKTTMRTRFSLGMAVAVSILSLGCDVADDGLEVPSATALTTDGPSPKRVAFDGTNGFLIVWSELDADFRDQIMGAKISTGGAILRDPFFITTGSRRKRNPDIALGGNGFLIVWQDEFGVTDNDIRAVRTDLSGTPTSNTEGAIIEFSGQFESSPRVAFSETNFRFLITYEKRPSFNSTSPSLAARHTINSDGTQGVGSEFFVLGGPGSGTTGRSGRIAAGAGKFMGMATAGPPNGPWNTIRFEIGAGQSFATGGAGGSRNVSTTAIAFSKQKNTFATLFDEWEGDLNNRFVQTFPQCAFNRCFPPGARVFQNLVSSGVFPPVEMVASGDNFLYATVHTVHRTNPLGAHLDEHLASAGQDCFSGSGKVTGMASTGGANSVSIIVYDNPCEASPRWALVDVQGQRFAP